MRGLRPETIYVSVDQVFLRGQVAPSASRVVEVVNGQPLTVVEHDGRYFKVKTAQGQVGWIEDHEVIDAKTYAAFEQLAVAHRHDPIEAHASLRVELYVHLEPGRQTERFYLLPVNSKVELLERASVSRTPEPVYAPLAKLAEPQSAPNGKAGQGQSGQGQSEQGKVGQGKVGQGKVGQGKVGQGKSGPLPAGATPATASARAAARATASARASAAASAPEPALAPVMEDWWLVRDSEGRTGWLLASQLSTDVPDAIEAYGGDMRFAGVWPLTEVTDPEADTPDHKMKMPEYVVALAAYQSGLPYDFDQVRVYTWSLSHHRYETAFELRSIEGFLPLHIATVNTHKGSVPAFSFEIAGSRGTTTDSAGVARPVLPRTLRYQLDGARVERIGPDLDPIAPTHEAHRKPKRHEKRPEKRSEKRRR